ncbi:hypothetical protein [Paraburkholderia sp. J8-2]|nr:hypothetical protein [Paraburkholderia sp. J8-2]
MKKVYALASVHASAAFGGSNALVEKRYFDLKVQHGGYEVI